MAWRCRFLTARWHSTHWLISTQAVILEEKDVFIKTLIQTPKGK